MEYSEKVLLPYIKQAIENVQRLELVRDEYIPNSLKVSTRQKRGTGARRRVLPSAVVPQNWQEFLRLDNNKKELFLFLSEQVVKMAIEGRQIIVTKEKRYSALHLRQEGINCHSVRMKKQTQE